MSTLIVEKTNITLNDIKDANPKFFDENNMRFFGKQKFELIKVDDNVFLRVEFIEKRQDIVIYEINENLKITNTVKD